MHQDLLYFLFQLQTTHKEGNNPEAVYEVQQPPHTHAHTTQAFSTTNDTQVILPHLLGTSIVNAYKLSDESLQGAWASQQRAGTCYYRCILAVSNYLLQRFGVNASQRKQLFYAIRVAYMQEVLRDLTSEHVRPLTDSDQRLILMGSAQVSLSALKLHRRGCLPADQLQRCLDMVKLIQQTMERLPTTGSAFSLPQRLKMQMAAPLEVFPGFELLADDRSTEGFAGRAETALPDYFVDLVPADKFEVSDDTCCWPFSLAVMLMTLLNGLLFPLCADFQRHHCSLGALLRAVQQAT